jgi:hypothetical protein
LQRLLGILVGPELQRRPGAAEPVAIGAVGDQQAAFAVGQHRRVAAEAECCTDDRVIRRWCKRSDDRRLDARGQQQKYDPDDQPAACDEERRERITGQPQQQPGAERRRSDQRRPEPARRPVERGRFDRRELLVKHYQIRTRSGGAR